ncbi:DNA replication protein [Lactobacillus halodurans]|uniref:DNA replication protein n=1 Tax=Companilactobacillus halodurans TaxID=2584183 RepID=A0A5P0ZL93_9LACO|nr:bifunctional DNA primase/polymerase [Companilactobacillus halodurans]MQS75014.1 DNA replication protein [Companilactobacillus halodurans]
MTTYEMALELAKRNIYYYPTAPGSKSGMKDTHGFNDAVNDESMAREWFDGTNNNIGINLKKSGLMVVDVDMHGNGNGLHSLATIVEKYGALPNDTLVEKTPRNGTHWFFKVPANLDLTNNVNAFFDGSGIDLMTSNVLIAPSSIDGVSYSNGSGTFDDIKQAPTWLLEFAQDKPANNVSSGTPRFKKYTGRLLDKIVKGATKGQRNNFITSIAGSMLAVGTSASNVYELLSVINQNFISPPLPQKELDTVYSSVVSRELRRLKVN